MNTIIVGAGLAGLMAGSIYQTSQIFEAANEDNINHKAVLRFRSSAVGDALGIDFRRVMVHKGIYIDGDFVAPNISLANYYSTKVIGRLADRSIWKIDPVERFIAPENLVEQLIDRCAGRITWNCKIQSLSQKENTISTAPMPVLAKLLDVDTDGVKFEHASIRVRRWRVPFADVFQTVYFPAPEINLYRASITGDLLIAEYVDANPTGDPNANGNPFESFSLTENECEELDVSRQGYGKIVAIGEAWRRKFILDASLKHNVFSLGRYATWRPSVLLDDVLKDIYIIKKLIGSDGYARTRHAAS